MTDSPKYSEGRLNFDSVTLGVRRAPREITAMNIHQAVSSVPTCDFLTNSHMGYLSKDN